MNGAIDVTPGVSRWEASTGRVEGHRVTLELDAARLARMCAANPPFTTRSARRSRRPSRRVQANRSSSWRFVPAADGIEETPYRGRRPGA